MEIFSLGRSRTLSPPLMVDWHDINWYSLWVIFDNKKKTKHISIAITTLMSFKLDYYVYSIVRFIALLGLFALSIQISQP